MEVISRRRMSNQRRILLEDHGSGRRVRRESAKKARDIHKCAASRNKGSKKRYPKPPSWARQACWPSKQALGPSAPTKGLLYLQNIYKIPANNPLITLCLHCPVYLSLLSVPAEDNSARCFYYPVNESRALALLNTVNASSQNCLPAGCS